MGVSASPGAVQAGSVGAGGTLSYWGGGGGRAPAPLSTLVWGHRNARGEGGEDSEAWLNSGEVP